MAQVSVIAAKTRPAPTNPATTTAGGHNREASTEVRARPPATRRTWRSSAHRFRPRTSGASWASQAFMPPFITTVSVRPAAASLFWHCSARLPVWQTRTRRPPASVTMRSRWVSTRPSGRLIDPGMWEFSYSAGVRTSTSRVWGSLSIRPRTVCGSMLWLLMCFLR